MKVHNLLALISILVWSASSVQNASAASVTETNSTPVMKRYTGAQEQDPVSRRLERMTKYLGLSTEQQAEIRPILLDAAARLKELRADTNQTVAEQKAKHQELRAATNDKIRTILTPEQLIKHDALLNSISERRKDRESKGSTVIPTR